MSVQHQSCRFSIIGQNCFQHKPIYLAGQLKELGYTILADYEMMSLLSSLFDHLSRR